ncbi:MAG: hypothetical protein ACON4U_11735 [Myxococcota bacterium]
MDDDILKMVLESELAAAQSKQKESQSKSQKKTKPNSPTPNQSHNSSQPSLEDGASSALPHSRPEYDSNPEPEGLNLENEQLIQEAMHLEVDSKGQIETDMTLEGDSVALLRQQLETFEQQNAALKATIKSQKEMLNRHAHDIKALTAQHAALADECAELRKRKSKDRTLYHSFKSRGLLGESEIVAAFQALGKSRQISELLPAIAVINAPKVEQILSEHIQLVSANLPSVLKLGVAQVQVSDDRCELVGQLDLAVSQRRFIDGLTTNGYSEVLILGAPLRMLAPLRAMAEHHQITFSFGPSVHRLTHESLIHLISDKSAVLVWNPEEQPFDPSILPHPPHVYSKAPNLAGFLLECGLVLLGNEDEDEGSES